jgi:hypothetical protein
MPPGLPHYAMRYLWDPYQLGSHRTRWPLGADQKCHPSRWVGYGALRAQSGQG